MDYGHEIPFYQIRADGIGYRARETVAGAQQAGADGAKVLGTTSRGLFLQSSGRWLVFISYERYLSPLTIAAPTSASYLYAVETGDSVLMNGQRLRFPGAKVDVLLPDRVWRPADPPAALQSFSDRVESLKEMVMAVAAAGRERGLGLLLRPLLSLPMERALPEEQQALLDAVVSLQRKLRAGDGAGAARAAGRLLGRGRGLTASGDDFLVGFLLFAGRHAGAVRPALPLGSFSRAIVDAAYRRTTTISANLIEAAVDGHSDERLLAAADCIATGSPSLRECLPPVLSWGASSGVDALAGMAGAVTL